MVIAVQTPFLLWAASTQLYEWLDFSDLYALKSHFCLVHAHHISAITHINLNGSFCAFLLVAGATAAGVKTLISATRGKVILIHPLSL